MKLDLLYKVGIGLMLVGLILVLGNAVRKYVSNRTVQQVPVQARTEDSNDQPTPLPLSLPPTAVTLPPSSTPVDSTHREKVVMDEKSPNPTVKQNSEGANSPNIIGNNNTVNIASNAHPTPADTNDCGRNSIDLRVEGAR